MTAPPTPTARNTGRTDVLIVGGGLAGLAAAAGLAEHGGDDPPRVTVLESRPRLGGRAASFLDKTTGERIDNCQHVAMGCCTNFLHLCRTAGLSKLLAPQDALTFVAKDGTRSRFAAHRLPAPLHLAGGFLGLKHLSFAEKRSFGRAVKRLAAERDGADVPFADWLERHGQGDRLFENVWQPVLVSALSETPERMNVADARRVFVDGFLRHREAWRVYVPTVPLDVLYGDRLAGWLRSRGVTVRTGAGVAAVHLNGRPSVTLRDGGELAADQLVLAVPHTRVPALLPADFAAANDLARPERLETAPISSVHLWFDRELTPLPHAVLPGRTSQWVFNRSRLQTGEGRGCDAAPGIPGHAYQVVISASRGESARPSGEVIAEVVAELRGAFPEGADAQLTHARLVTEHAAVFSPLPGHHRFRPPTRTTRPDVHLAGDWTATGWPATMEGAVRSGFAAAEALLTARGTPRRVLIPDLPTGRLARVLLGLGGCAIPR